ncbi:MAG: hypothetical protein IT372_41475 [Polyangiaceae bacterium]|nr:hypothetical protein [Polyangiaceae bacterium]
MITGRAPRLLLRSSLALLCAAALAASCGDDEQLSPAGAGGGTTSSTTSSTTTTPTGAAGGGGCGATCQPSLLVGASRRIINPTLVETEWQDLDGDGYWEEGVEPYTDTNGNGHFDAVWIAGFGTGRPATAQHDDLEVRAIALEHEGTTVVICVLDVVGYFIDEMDRIREDPSVAALGVDHIMIAATHTHEGVDTIGLWGPDPVTSGRSDDYQAVTRLRAAEAIVEAVTTLAPARMRVAQAVTAGPGGTLDYVNDTRDPIIYDPTLTVAQFTDESTGDTIATLVNWASHPEYTGSHNNELSADYVHWLREVVEVGVPSEGLLGLGGTTVFINGPIGGQVGPGGGVHPIDAGGAPVPQAGLAKAEAAGTSVGKLALDAILTSGEDVADASIVLRSEPIEVRIDNLAYHFLANAGVFDRQFYNHDPSQPLGEGNLPWARTQITYLQVGPRATITAPGELHPELWVGGYDGTWSWGQSMLNVAENAPDMSQAPAGPYLRELMLANPGVKYAFVSGLAEDFLGYIIPAFNYVLHPAAPYFAEAAGDHYEETNSAGPAVEEQVQHPMLELAGAAQ